MVRSNAAGLLMDAFPLQNPDAGNEEIDLMLQKQFDIFEVKKQTRGAHLWQQIREGTSAPSPP